MKSDHEYSRDDLVLLHLLACALNDAMPDEAAVEAMDSSNVYRLACSHSVDALVASALGRYWESHPASEDESHAWRQSEAHAQYLETLFSLERQTILDYLDEQGIWHMQMKGSLLRDLYPCRELRQMCDIDILFDPEYRDKVRSWFLGRGFTIEMDVVPNSPHDQYKKPPVYNVEMHNRLLNGDDKEPWFSYFKDVKPRLVPVEGTKCEFRFTVEDDYLYILTHAAKHYFCSGTGLRTLVDVYVYNRAYGESLDRAYVDEELVKLDLSAFERVIRGLSDKVLNGVGLPLGASMQNVLDVDEADMLARVFESNTYGTVHNRLRMQIKDSSALSRLKYVARRAVPPRDTIKEHYPFTKRYPVLLPAAYLYRLLYSAFSDKRRNRMRKELKEIRGFKE